jgi:hypothetical protein
VAFVSAFDWFCDAFVIDGGPAFVNATMLYHDAIKEAEVIAGVAIIGFTIGVLRALHGTFEF